MYSNSCCSSSFEPEIIKIGLSFHKMYSNNILSFQESMTILNACTKKARKPIVCTTYIDVYGPILLLLLLLFESSSHQLTLMIFYLSPSDNKSP